MPDKRKLAGLLCGLAAAGLLSSCAPAQTLPAENGAEPAYTPVILASGLSAGRVSPEAMEPIAEKGFLALYADPDTGEFAVEDRRNGRLWHSNPPDRTEDAVATGAMRNRLSSQLLVNTIIEETKTVKSYNSFVSCTKRGGVAIELTADGFKTTYTFVKEGFSIPVYYTLLEDSLRAEIRAEEIREESEIRVLSVTLLPMMGAFGKSEEGFILLGNGSIIDFSNGKTDVAAYRAPIYGDDAVTVAVQRQTAVADVALPVFGLSARTHGLLAVCDKGAGQGYLNAAPAGLQTGYQSACAEFELRITQLVTVGSDDGNGREVTTLEKTDPTGQFSVRYFFLDEEETGLAAMADITAAYYRSQGVTPQEMPENAPLYLTVLGAVRYPSSVAGFRVNVTRTMTSYTQAVSMLQSMTDSGVSGVRMIYDGWSRSALSGKITAGFDPAGGLGSDREREALANALIAQDGILAFRADVTQYRQSGNGFSLKSDSIRDVLHRTVELPVYKRNTFLPDNTRSTGRMLRAKSSAQAFLRLSSALPDGAALSLGEYGSALSTDYGNGGMKRYAAQTLTAQTLTAAAKERLLIGDAPHAYALPALREAVNLPLGTADCPVVDRNVPFPALVLRQLMPCGSQPVNQSGNPTRDFLRYIAAGIAPHYEVSASPPEELKNTDKESFYGADFAALKAMIPAQYARWAALYARIRNAHIVSLTVSGGLTETVYDNGVTTWVNTTSEPLTVGDRQIPAEDFVVTGGSTS